MIRQRIVGLILALILSGCTIGNRSHKTFKQYIRDNQCDQASLQIPLEGNEVDFFETTKRFVGYLGSYVITLASVTVGVFIGVSGNHPELGVVAGQLSDKTTYRMRCPNLDKVANKLADLASCYENKNTKTDTKQALLALYSMRRREEFYECVSESVQKRIKNNLYRVAKIRQSQGDDLRDYEIEAIIDEISLLHSKEDLPKKCKFVKQFQLRAKDRVKSRDFYGGERTDFNYLAKREAHKEGADHAMLVWQSLGTPREQFAIVDIYDC